MFIDFASLTIDILQLANKIKYYAHIN